MVIATNNHAVNMRPSIFSLQQTFIYKEILERGLNKFSRRFLADNVQLLPFINMASL